EFLAPGRGTGAGPGTAASRTTRTPLDALAHAGPGLRPARRHESVRAGRGRAVRNPLEDVHTVVDDAAHLAVRGLDDGFVVGRGSGDGRRNEASADCERRA